jgi:hypothetical protein
MLSASILAATMNDATRVSSSAMSIRAWLLASVVVIGSSAGSLVVVME